MQIFNFGYKIHDHPYKKGHLYYYPNIIDGRTEAERKKILNATW